VDAPGLRPGVPSGRMNLSRCALALVLASPACREPSGPAAPPSAAPAPSALAPSVCKPRVGLPWSYDPDSKNPPGTDHWGEVQGYERCAAPKATRQSPIQLSPEIGAPRPAPAIAFGKAPVKEWVNTGHSLETRFAPGATLQVGDATYTLLNVHFHVPAEHLVGKRQYEMEMHAVTARENPAERVVFGVFFALGERPGPPLLARMLGEFTRNAHDDETCSRSADSAGSGVVLDLRPLLSAGSPLLTYEGSLTVPPCDENVTFYIARKALPVSQAELDGFTTRVGVPSTARPLQPRNGREVHETPAPTLKEE
jgi:carbonic anhydrase